MELRAESFVPATVPAGLTVREAPATDLAAVLAVDAAGFGEPLDVERGWVEPRLHAREVRVALAEPGGVPVATACTVRSDRWNGPAAPAPAPGGAHLRPARLRRGTRYEVHVELSGPHRVRTALPRPHRRAPLSCAVTKPPTVSNGPSGSSIPVAAATSSRWAAPSKVLSMDILPEDLG